MIAVLCSHISADQMAELRVEHMAATSEMSPAADLADSARSELEAFKAEHSRVLQALTQVLLLPAPVLLLLLMLLLMLLFCCCCCCSCSAADAAPTVLLLTLLLLCCC